MKEWKMGVRWRGWGLEVCLSVVLIIIAAIIGNIEAEQKGKTCVITLDHSNFAHIVSKHDFILVQFYAPWYVSISTLYYSLLTNYLSLSSYTSLHFSLLCLGKSGKCSINKKLNFCVGENSSPI